MKIGEDTGRVPFDALVKQGTREGMARVLDAVLDVDVECALEDIFSRDTDLGSDYREDVRKLLEHPTGGIILDSGLETIKGMPVDVLKLEHHLAQMNHPDVWAALLKKAIEHKPEVEKDLRGAFLFVLEPNMLIPVASQVISESNSKLFARTLLYYGIAVTSGNEFEDITNPILRVHEINGEKYPSNRYAAGLAVAKHFGTRAKSPTHAVERLQDLFPPNPRNGSDIPALQIASATKAFTYETAKSVGVCPVKDTSRQFFKAYGNLLAKPEFQDRLTAQISNK